MKRFRPLSLIVFLVLILFATSGYGSDESRFYWANGEKVYIDPIPGEYLALYEEGDEQYSREQYSLGGKSLRTVAPPEEISLPSNASLVQLVEETRLESMEEVSSGKVLRTLVPAFIDRETHQMVLPTDKVIVQFQPEVDEETATEIISLAGLTDPEPSSYAANQFLARHPLGGTEAIDAANELYTLPEVKFSHPEMIKGKVHYFIPNDTYYDEQWHLYNSGKDGAVLRADINVESAWDITRGSVTTRVGIADDGIMWNHEDLIGNYIMGYDFAKGTTDTSPQSYEWHGTAVAGLAVGKGDNGVGISGTCPNCGLVTVAYGPFTNQDAEMFYWQNDVGVMVSSNSWGYTDHVLPDVVRQAITDVTTSGRNGRGMVVVVAAGNEASQIQSLSFANHPNVITVGASTSEDVRAWYSNLGNGLDVMAPSSGGRIDITTTDVYSPYGSGYNPGGYSGNYSNGRYTDDFGGTSASTPITAGVVGLMLSANPQLTIEQVKRALLYTSDKIGNIAYGSDGRNTSYGYGRINARKAVMAALAADHTSWWHDAQEIGSGISIEVQGLRLYLSWYAYDSSGRPSWLTSEGSMTDQDHYSGNLLRWTGPPLGNETITPQSQVVGTITITFLEDDQAEVAYTLTSGSVSGSMHMTRLLDTIVPKVTTARDVRDIHGWWSTAGANGMDFFIENRNSLLLVTWNNYHDDFTSRWWATGGPFTIGSSLYSARLDAFHNGQCFGCPYSFPNPIEPLGPVSVQFLSESQAVLTWNGSSYTLNRLFFGSTP